MADIVKRIPDRLGYLPRRQAGWRTGLDRLVDDFLPEAGLRQIFPPEAGLWCFFPPEDGSGDNFRAAPGDKVATGDFGGDWLEPFVLNRRLGDLAMPLDVIEEKDKLVVKAELPGMEQKDIRVDLNDGVLTIKAEKKQESEEKDKHYHRVERTYGSFSRSLVLPSYVEAGKVEASYKDGVLSITLPKKEEAKPKKIEIEVK